MAAGQALYLAKGCAVCHGQEAQGSTFAPALPGHSVAQVQHQVRNPVGNMPAFTTGQVTDQELGEIAAFIASLEGSMAHVEPLEMEDVVVAHHWMAIWALKSGSVSDAAHHLEHIIELVEDEHEHEIEEALTALQSGDLHEAEHTVETMLAGTADPDLSLAQLHLRLALASIEVGASGDAVHHMDHFLEAATGMDRTKSQEVMALLKAGEHDEAAHEIEGLLEMETAGH